MTEVLTELPFVTDADRLSTGEVAAAFEEHGIVVVTRFVDPSLAARAATEVDAVVAAEPGRPASFSQQGYDARFDTMVRNWTIGEVRDRVPTCRAILRDPRLDQWAVAICGPDYLRQPASIASTFEGCGQAWHQDSSYREPQHYTLNRIVFADDVPPERGRLVVVPGSHRAGDLPPGGLYDRLEGQVAIGPPAGTVVLMHSRLFHMVERNRSRQPRSQFNGRVQPQGSPPDVVAQPRFRTGTWDFRTGGMVLE